MSFDYLMTIVQWSAVAQLVELLTLDRKVVISRLAAGSNCVVFFIRCLVLVQPRKTCPDMTEKLLIVT